MSPSPGLTGLTRGPAALLLMLGRRRWRPGQAQPREYQTASKSGQERQDIVARILVTGAAGFIGTALCPALAAQGHDVVAALRRAASTPRGINTEIVGDITAASDWRQALRGVEIVVHLAQRAHVGPD